MTFEIVDCTSLVSKGKPKMSQSVSVQVSVRLDVTEWYNLQLVLAVSLNRPAGNKQFIGVRYIGLRSAKRR